MLCGVQKAVKFLRKSAEHQCEKAALQAACAGGLHAFGDGGFSAAVSHEQELDARPMCVMAKPASMDLMTVAASR